MVKRNNTPFYILAVFMLLSNTSFLYAFTFGFGRIDSRLGPGEVAVDAWSDYPLGTEVYILNQRTGQGTRARVKERFDTTPDITAKISRDIAGKIGIQGEGEPIELRSLAEAQVDGFMNIGGLPPKEESASLKGSTPKQEQSPSPVPEEPQNGSGLAEEPRNPSNKPDLPEGGDKGVQNLSIVSGNPPPVPPGGRANPENLNPDAPRNAPGNGKDASPAREVQNSPIVSGNPPPVPSGGRANPENPSPDAPRNAPGDNKDTPPAIADFPQITPLSAPPLQVAREDPKVNDRPENFFVAPETTLPDDSRILPQREEVLLIHEAPHIDVPSKVPAKIADTPQVSMPPSSLIAQGDRTFPISDKPVLENSLVIPETTLPDRNPTPREEDAAIHEAPEIPEIGMAPEINLPAESLWIVRNEEPRIEEGAAIHEAPEIPEIGMAPEINLPAESLWIVKNEEPRISESPKVNETNLSQKNPWDYSGDEYTITLVPAENRPPAEKVTVTIPPEAEIAPIPPAPPPSRSRDGGVYLDPALSIAPIASPQGPVPPPKPPLFSVPLITALEKGKYYVQLVALSKSELVESELSKIGGSYPLAIQTAGSQDHPLYRILLGPMNQGESGALLQRFKGIGYRDAFVRQGS